MGTRNSVLLTRSTVDACLPGEKRIELWDSELKGFGLRVEPSGVKTFFAKYRAEGGGRASPQRKVTIGRFGTLTVEQARKQAKMILGSVAVGRDPARDLQARRREIRMSALIDLYEQEGCVIQRGLRQGEPMKPRTKKLTLARLRHHVVSLLGNRRVSDIGTGEIEKFFADVTNGKTARDEKTGPRTRIMVRGGAGAARKVFRDLSAVFSFALRIEIVSRNPCATAAVRKTDGHRTRFLTVDELTQLGKAINELEKEGGNQKALDIIRLLALTGCRKEEIAGLKWSEVNLEGGLLELADSKTGRSVRPLGAAAQTFLARLAKEKSSDFVFPADRGDSHFQGVKKVWAKVIAKAELSGVTPHTLRHTLGSMATSTGEALALTGAILGHANMRSTAIYAHVQHDPSKRAADRISKKIAAALTGVANGQDGNQKARRAADRQLLRAVAEQLAVDKEGANDLRAALENVISANGNSAITKSQAG